MPENATSDSSPLINLFLIDRFSLLKEFFKQITIPEAVWQELVETDKAGVEFFKQERESGFLVIKKIEPSAFLSLLYRELDRGEAEAISLALNNKAEILLVDEKEARSIAREYQLPLTGVVGILLRAKLEQKIPSLRRELQLLRDNGFWIDDELCSEATRACGEKWDSQRPRENVS